MIQSQPISVLPHPGSIVWMHRTSHETPQVYSSHRVVGSTEFARTVPRSGAAAGTANDSTSSESTSQSQWQERYSSVWMHMSMHEFPHV